MVLASILWSLHSSPVEALNRMACSRLSVLDRRAGGLSYLRAESDCSVTCQCCRGSIGRHDLYEYQPAKCEQGQTWRAVEDDGKATRNRPYSSPCTHRCKRTGSIPCHHPLPVTRRDWMAHGVGVSMRSWVSFPLFHLGMTSITNL